MKFFKSNFFKIPVICVLYALLGVFLSLCSSKPYSEIVIRFAIFYSLLCTAITILIGMRNFYVRERLLFETPGNSVLDMFDNGVYTVNMNRSTHLFLFVQQELVGVISGYPVTVKIDPTKSGSFDIIFSGHKTQGIYAGHNKTQVLPIPWDWRRRLTANIKDEVTKFIAKMQSQGDNTPAHISEI